MKTLSLFAALVLFFLLSAEAQQERYSKNDKIPQKKEDPSLHLVDPAIKISNLDGGGGSYEHTFYYGDPCGIYLDKEWQTGYAELVDGDLMGGDFRYNICVQKMEAVVDGDTFAFAKSEELYAVVIGETKFIYRPYVRGDGEHAYTWFEVLNEGNCKLVLRRFIKYRKTYDDNDPSNDQLYRLQEYYCKCANEPYERVHLSRQSVNDVLPRHEAELNKFMKTNKIRLKSGDDLIRVFVYYNGLD